MFFMSRDDFLNEQTILPIPKMIKLITLTVFSFFANIRNQIQNKKNSLFYKSWKRQEFLLFYLFLKNILDFILL